MKSLFERYKEKFLAVEEINIVEKTTVSPRDRGNDPATYNRTNALGRKDRKGLEKSKEGIHESETSSD